MTRTLLVDTDTASDDAVALIMALRSAEVRVAAITVVAGNVPVARIGSMEPTALVITGTSRQGVAPSLTMPWTR